MPSDTHDQLTQLGARWLKRQGFPVVATELRSAGCPEQPDVIGFRSTCSAIIEVKVSRGDFWADDKKPWRSVEPSGLGNYRFYLCPQGLLTQDDLPPKWGLLHSAGGRIIEVKRPVGNLWTRSTTNERWQAFLFPSDLSREHAVLFSVARRLAQAAAPT
ncbi:MAG: hypothetical protein K2X75_02295 [Burkholderiaceae bacterium]|nr:hypothetical protein [Burkholderiaceae bacterium]